MSIQTSYLSPNGQLVDPDTRWLILRQNSGAIATGGGDIAGKNTSGWAWSENPYILLSQAEYELIRQYIYVDAAVTFFDDYLKTAEFLFSQDLDGDGQVSDTIVDRAYKYAFDGSKLKSTSSLTIEFSQTPSNLQLIFVKLDQNGYPVSYPSFPNTSRTFSFVPGVITKLDLTPFIGSYDGVNNVLNFTFVWDDIYGPDYKNVIGSGSVMVAISAGMDSLSDGAMFATAIYGSNVADEIDGSSSSDEIFALSGDDLVVSGLGDDIVDGAKGIDYLDGGAGDDFLIGGAGNDTMLGGLGDDNFTVDSKGDVILENENEGNDTVNSYISYTISEHLENITLLGSKAINANGNNRTNTLTGNSAANILNGLGGQDTLNGGAGNDIYVVYGDGETILDTAGTDLVRSYGTWALTASLENLTLLDVAEIDGTGNDLNNTITGNSSDNILEGEAGNDVLISGAGNDTLDGGVGEDKMTGGTGDDIYFVDNVKDTVAEKTGGGIDTIETTLVGLSIAKLSAIENLTYNGLRNATLVGNTLANILRGSTGNDTLNGSAGNDILLGGNGSDILIGGLGNNTLTGGDDADAFRFDKVLGKTNIDTINDFVSGTDKIELDDFIFKKFIGDSDVSDNFASSSETQVSMDYLVAKTVKVGEIDSMALFYDADGNGKGAPVQFATLIGVTDLSVADFLIV